MSRLLSQFATALILILLVACQGEPEDPLEVRSHAQRQDLQNLGQATLLLPAGLDVTQTGLVANGALRLRDRAKARTSRAATSRSTISEPRRSREALRRNWESKSRRAT